MLFAFHGGAAPTDVAGQENPIDVKAAFHDDFSHVDIEQQRLEVRLEENVIVGTPQSSGLTNFAKLIPQLWASFFIQFR